MCVNCFGKAFTNEVTHARFQTRNEKSEREREKDDETGMGEATRGLNCHVGDDRVN